MVNRIGDSSGWPIDCGRLLTRALHWAVAPAGRNRSPADVDLRLCNTSPIIARRATHLPGLRHARDGYSVRGRPWGATGGKAVETDCVHRRLRPAGLLVLCSIVLAGCSVSGPAVTGLSAGGLAAAETDERVQMSDEDLVARLGRERTRAGDLLASMAVERVLGRSPAPSLAALIDGRTVVAEARTR